MTSYLLEILLDFKLWSCLNGCFPPVEMHLCPYMKDKDMCDFLLFSVISTFFLLKKKEKKVGLSVICFILC